jgi:hypothetical protein
MPVTSQWIPFDSLHDFTMINQLIHEQRRFYKGLRFNLIANKPYANIILSDTEPPVAMWIIPADKDDDYREEINSMVSQSHMSNWIWPLDQQMPEIPAVNVAG